MICSSCSNEFIQPFVCTTCGAQKLRDYTLEMLEKEIAALRKKKEWVNLTDEEINSIDFPESGTATMRDFIRIIEAKLKEKNSG